MKLKASSLKRLTELIKILARLTKGKREKPQITDFRNKRGDRTHYRTDAKRIRKDSRDSPTQIDLPVLNGRI